MISGTSSSVTHLVSHSSSGFFLGPGRARAGRSVDTDIVLGRCPVRTQRIGPQIFGRRNSFLFVGEEFESAAGGLETHDAAVLRSHTELPTRK